MNIQANDVYQGYHQPERAYEGGTQVPPIEPKSEPMMSQSQDDGLYSFLRKKIKNTIDGREIDHDQSSNNDVVKDLARDDWKH